MVSLIAISIVARKTLLVMDSRGINSRMAMVLPQMVVKMVRSGWI